jgi:transposase
MSQKFGPVKEPADKIIQTIRRASRKPYSAEEKIRIVLEGLRGEDSIAELCRREGIAQNLYYRWSKDFLEASKKRLAGDTTRQATSDEVRVLRRERNCRDQRALAVLARDRKISPLSPDGVVVDLVDEVSLKLHQLQLFADQFAFWNPALFLNKTKTLSALDPAIS